MKKLSFVLASLLLGACSHSSVQSTWKSPEASAVRFHKVLVIAPFADPLERQIAETQLVNRIKAPHAIASFALFPEGVPGDLQQLKARMDALGIDGVVVFRVVGDEKTSAGVATQHQYAYSGWPVSQPAHINLRGDVKSQIDVYAVPDQLLWSGLSETSDPTAIAFLVDSASKALKTPMRQQGLVVLR